MIVWTRDNRAEWRATLLTETIYLLTRQSDGGWEVRFWPCSRLARTIGRGDLRAAKQLCQEHFSTHVWPRIYGHVQEFVAQFRGSFRDELLPHPKKARTMKFFKA